MSLFYARYSTLLASALGAGAVLSKSSSNSLPVISFNAFKEDITYIEIKSKYSFLHQMKKDQAFYAPCFRPAFFQIHSVRNSGLLQSYVP